MIRVRTNHGLERFTYSESLVFHDRWEEYEDTAELRAALAAHDGFQIRSEGELKATAPVAPALEQQQSEQSDEESTDATEAPAEEPRKKGRR